MKLPHGDHARVDREKITEYLLNAAHPDGAGKAAFLTAHGFSMDAWHTLAEALKEHARTHPISTCVESFFGTRYTVEGKLHAPDGRSPMVRCVWIVERGSKTPRLITVYPVKRRGGK